MFLLLFQVGFKNIYYCNESFLNIYYTQSLVDVPFSPADLVR